MWLSDAYDIPEGVAAGSHSPVFAKFLRSWFADTRAITHGELDIRFLDDLTPEELSLARELIRRNLKTKHSHIIEGGRRFATLTQFRSCAHCSTRNRI
jgi:hypothetical protein